MNYREYKDQKQSEFNSLPIFFAFSNERFKEEMEKRGLSENDTDQIYRFGDTGGFYLRKDADLIHEYFNREDSLSKLMGKKKFAVDAFCYEMQNHEYHINWQGDWDVCSCFGDCEYGENKTYRDYLIEEGYSEEVVGFYKEARAKFYKKVEKNNWW